MTIPFNELLNSISSKMFIMHCDSVPLRRFWFCTHISLIIHTTSPKCKYGDSSSISQNLLNRSLPDFTTKNCLHKNIFCYIQLHTSFSFKLKQFPFRIKNKHLMYTSKTPTSLRINSLGF